MNEGTNAIQGIFRAINNVFQEVATGLSNVVSQAGEFLGNLS